MQQRAVSAADSLLRAIYLQAALTLALACPAFAQTSFTFNTNYTPAPGDPNPKTFVWSDPRNWAPGGIPGAEDTAFISQYSEITGTFTGADIPNLEKADTREKLQQLLGQDVRKIIITTIFKFGEATGCLNDRSNIIALVDEAHRTQEGDLGDRKSVV